MKKYRQSQIKVVKKNKPRKDKNTQRVWVLHIIVFSLNFSTVGRHLIQGDAKINQHKGILTSKFESKDMLFWKRGSAFDSTEDEDLWIPSRLMLFDGTRSPEMSP